MTELSTGSGTSKLLGDTPELWGETSAGIELSKASLYLAFTVLGDNSGLGISEVWHLHKIEMLINLPMD